MNEHIKHELDFFMNLNKFIKENTSELPVAILYIHLDNKSINFLLKENIYSLTLKNIEDIIYQKDNLTITYTEDSGSHVIRTIPYKIIRNINWYLNYNKDIKFK